MLPMRDGPARPQPDWTQRAGSFVGMVLTAAAGLAVSILAIAVLVGHAWLLALLLFERPDSYP